MKTYFWLWYHATLIQWSGSAESLKHHMRRFEHHERRLDADQHEAASMELNHAQKWLDSLPPLKDGE